jgi:hypothetical protein
MEMIGSRLENLSPENSGGYGRKLDCHVVVVVTAAAAAVAVAAAVAYVKKKVKLPLCLKKHHTMKMYGESRFSSTEY